MRLTSGALGALGVAAVLALGACTDDPEPRIADPTPTSESTTTPTSTPPTSEPTSEVTTPPVEVLTPEETVRAWVEARNELLRSGDASAVEALSARNCISCDGLMDTIVQIYKDGGYVRTDGWTVLKARPTPDFNSSRVIAVSIRISGGETLEAAGGTPRRFEDERALLDFTLRPRGPGWIVADVVFLS